MTVPEVLPNDTGGAVIEFARYDGETIYQFGEMPFTRKDAAEQVNRATQ